MHELALTAIGKDRPGIVAGVTKVLFELGCNLSDCSMTLLGGQFAMIMLIEAPDGLSASDLQHSLEPTASRMALSITVTDATDSTRGPEHLRPYVISLYGSDHPGIVYTISNELASQHVNITDLVSRIAGGIYTVMLDVELPPGLDASTLDARLRPIAAEMGVEVTLRTAEPDEL